MSNLVDHARVELEKVESDPWIIDGMIKVVAAFAEMGHSGGSASVCIPMLNDLLQYKNLAPLTDDPNEWIDQSAYTATPGVKLWQNKRNPAAFSENGGKTYYVLNEDPSEDSTEGRTFHTAEISGKRHKSWDHPEDDHSEHVHVAPSTLPPVSQGGGIVESSGHD